MKEGKILINPSGEKALEVKPGVLIKEQGDKIFCYLSGKEFVFQKVDGKLVFVSSDINVDEEDAKQAMAEVDAYVNSDDKDAKRIKRWVADSKKQQYEEYGRTKVHPEDYNIK